MPVTLRTAFVAALACAATLLPAVAHADRWVAPDDRGDVEGWHFDPEPRPCGTDTMVDASADTNDDITRLRVRHTRTEIRLRARFRDLDPALDQTVSFHLATERRGWILGVDRWQNAAGRSRVSVFFGREPKQPDLEEGDECGTYFVIIDEAACRIARAVDVDTDLVTATLPRACLRNPRWVRVGMDAFGYVEPESPEGESYTGFSDEWGSADGVGGWLPPFGPRVRAPRAATSADPAGPRGPASTGERRAYTVGPDGRVKVRSYADAP